LEVSSGHKRPGFTLEMPGDGQALKKRRIDTSDNSVSIVAEAQESGSNVAEVEPSENADRHGTYSYWLCSISRHPQDRSSHFYSYSFILLQL
jgi:hypothetical protein